MQIFLIAVAVPLLLLAVALEEGGKAELDAHEQRAQLTHLSRVAMLGELSGGIAHELNQPLTAILSNAQAAQRFMTDKSGSPETLAEILRDIITADQRAVEVIRRLHALFKRGETHFESLDLNEVAREVIAIVRGELVLRAIDVAVQFGDAAPRVRGDRVELQQVLLNLVMNACDAMAQNLPAHRRLTLRTVMPADRAWLRIEVSDMGRGLTAANPEQVFERYYTTKPHGVGLGLSVCRTIMAAHGGSLEAFNNPEGGATFVCTLGSPPA